MSNETVTKDGFYWLFTAVQVVMGWFAIMMGWAIIGAGIDLDRPSLYVIGITGAG